MNGLGITEEKRLIRRFRSKGFRSRASQSAFELLAESLAPLMKSLSRRLCRDRRISFDEAMQAALRGVWFAAMDYQPKFNVRLATRAFTKIMTQHAMLKKETEKFYAGGRLGVSTDLDVNLDRKPQKEKPAAVRSGKPNESQARLIKLVRKAVGELNDAQQSAILSAGYCSPLRGENRPLPEPSKYHLDKAVKTLKRVLGKHMAKGATKDA